MASYSGRLLLHGYLKSLNIYVVVFCVMTPFNMVNGRWQCCGSRMRW